MLIIPLIFSNLIFLCFINKIEAVKGNDLPIEQASGHGRDPEAKCSFRVHVKGPNGAEVKDVTLDQELYYKISCEPVKGYCLRVSNCSVTTDAPGQKPYLIIDGRGCTTEPSLFKHVQYEDNFTAGIYNPYPIRFRNQKSTVQFNCDTSLVLLSQDGKCQRERCVWNEYTKEANEQQTNKN
ncbi:hypothetical protein ACQ4LE_001349 [Meloidogyne hapla]